MRRNFLKIFIILSLIFVAGIIVYIKSRDFQVSRIRGIKNKFMIEECLVTMKDSLGSLSYLYQFVGVKEEDRDKAFEMMLSETCSCVVNSAVNVDLSSFLKDEKNVKKIKKCNDDAQELAIRHHGGSLGAKVNDPIQGRPLIVCPDEDQKDWIKLTRQANMNSELYKYAETLFGQVTKCTSKDISSEPEVQYGTFVYHHENSAEASFSSLPPETSDSRLTSSSGFPNEKQAIEKIKEITKEIGLSIEWNKKPDILNEKGIETKTYWDKDGGTNGRGYFIYKNKKLIVIGYGMAL